MTTERAASITRCCTAVGALAVALVLWAAPPSLADDTAAPTASSVPAPSQLVTATRPAGQIVVLDIWLEIDGTLHLTVMDTRDHDPGWAVTVSGVQANRSGASVVDHAAPFDDANGHLYSQEVSPGEQAAGTLASAAPLHGLGIAHVETTLAATPEALVTITVI